MVLVSLMDIHVIISGAMLLVHLKLILHRAIAHALQHKELSHKNLLAVTTTVNQDILATHSYL